MTAALEGRYRRLLAVYPAAHRRDYEEEMVGVLMEGAEPGQLRPTLGDAADLLWSGLVARLGRDARQLRTPDWRDAAGVAGLIAVVLLAGAAGRRLVLGLQNIHLYGDPMRAFGVDGALLLDVAARSAAWLAVLLAVLLAARRTAVALAVVALLVEVATVVVWLPQQEFRAIRMSWALTLALITVALLVLSRRGRPVAAIIGRRGIVLIGGGLSLTVLSAFLLQWWPLPQFVGPISGTAMVLVVAGAMLLAGLRAVPAAVRRRTVVLLAPVLAAPIAQDLLETAIDINVARYVTPAIVVVDVLMMTGLPLLALGLVAAAVQLWGTVTITVTRKSREETV